MSIFKLIKAFRPLLSGPESHEKLNKEYNLNLMSSQYPAFSPHTQHSASEVWLRTQGVLPYSSSPKGRAEVVAGMHILLGGNPSATSGTILAGESREEEDMSPPQDLQLLLRLENAASPLTPAAQKLWKTTDRI